MRHIWIKDDLDYLRERYGKEKAGDIAAYLEVSTQSVVSMARRLGLTAGRGRPLGKVNPNEFERRTDWKDRLLDILDEATKRDEAGEEVEIHSKGSRFDGGELMAVFSRERA